MRNILFTTTLMIAMCGNAASAPIELAHFFASLAGAQVDVYWKTSSELENTSFTVERSSNGLDWEALFIIPGAGTSQQTNEYRVRDNFPMNGVSYYRLKQTDNGGLEEHFAAVQVNYTAPTGDVIVYPNPAYNTMSLIIGDGPSQIFVYDEMGRVVISRAHNGGRAELDLTDSPAGKYTVVVSNAAGTTHSRIVKY